MTQADTADAPSEPLPGPMQDWLRHLKPTAATRRTRWPATVANCISCTSWPARPASRWTSWPTAISASSWRDCTRRAAARAAWPARWPPGAASTNGGRQRWTWPAIRWPACARPRPRAPCPRRCRWTRPRRCWTARLPRSPTNRPPCATRPCSNCSIPAACGCPSWSAWTCAMNAPRNTSRAAGSTWTKRRSWCWARAASAVRCPWARPRWRPCASGSRRGRS